jgi:energy-coupling factor transporter ATP-binding protein EcfA2
MNIIEAYIKYNDGICILISGLSGSGKSSIANKMNKLFNIDILNLDSYCIENNDRKFQLTDSISITDWEHIDSYNWENFNKDLIKYKKKGVIAYGPYFPTNKINIEADYHLNVRITKQKLEENRHNFIKENPFKCKELTEYLNTPIEHLIINKMSYPYYLNYTKESTVTKVFDVADNTTDKMYKDMCYFLFALIKKSFEEKNTSSKSISKTDNEESLYMGTIQQIYD